MSVLSRALSYLMVFKNLLKSSILLSFLIEIQLTYNIRLVSGAQHNDLIHVLQSDNHGESS